MPSAAEVAEEGMAVGELEVKLVEKVEELTLYILDQQELIQLMQQEIEKLKAANN
ncbi:MAG: hypothetical protein ACI87N_002595 [Flavobacteriales bacterium]|jgi:hypothetical protein